LRAAVTIEWNVSVSIVLTSRTRTSIRLEIGLVQPRRLKSQARVDKSAL